MDVLQAAAFSLQADASSTQPTDISWWEITFHLLFLSFSLRCLFLPFLLFTLFKCPPPVLSFLSVLFGLSPLHVRLIADTGGDDFGAAILCCLFVHMWGEGDFFCGGFEELLRFLWYQKAEFLVRAALGSCFFVRRVLCGWSLGCAVGVGPYEVDQSESNVPQRDVPSVWAGHPNFFARDHVWPCYLSSCCRMHFQSHWFVRNCW